MVNHADAASRSQDPKPWSLRVPLSFFAHDLTDRERIVFQLLDCYARNDTYCFVGYRTIAGLVRKTVRSVQDIVATLERKGFVRTLHAQGRNSSRVGIVLLKRVNPDENPAADTPHAVEEAEAALRNRTQAGAREETCMQKPSPDLDAEAGRRQRFLSVREREDDASIQESEAPAAPTGITVVASSEDADDAGDALLDRMVALAYVLPGLDDHAARPLVDEFADLSVLVTWDHDGNRRCHCAIALSLQRGELAPVSVDAIARDHAARLEADPDLNPEIYVAAIQRAKRQICLAS